MLYERDSILQYDWMGDFVYRVANKRQSKKYVILKKLENEIDLNEDEIKFMLEMETQVQYEPIDQKNLNVDDNNVNKIQEGNLDEIEYHDDVIYNNHEQFINNEYSQSKDNN